MKIRFFIGINISKKTLDFAVRNTQRLLFHLKVENSSAGIDTFKSYCQERQVALEDSILCCEHTGIYSQHVLSFATQDGISLWLESSTRIKRSIGLQRGKSDNIDAIRISEYAFRYADQAKLWQPEREVLLELKHLVGLRKRLMLAKDTLQVPLKEAADFQDKKLSKKMQALNQKPIKALQKQIQQVEKQIRTLVKEDDVLHHLFGLVTSVSGVGEVIFWEVIITTNEFKLFSCPRKFACYAGVAPFEHSSGTSIRGKTRVSHLANKQLKQLFHMAAMSVTLRENELADYYHRKVEEGKSKMSVLNAVRNKIIHRIFACVRNDRKYEKNYMTTLA